MSEDEALHHKWEHSLLSYDSKKYIEELPYILNLSIEGVNIAVVHYSISKDNRYINFKANPNSADCEN